jgi:PAS domain S-box-containing protein
MKNISNLAFSELVDGIFKDAMSTKLNFQVKNFMRQDPSVLDTEDSLKDALRIIIEEKIDAVPIVSKDNEIVGIVTKTHLLREIHNGGGLDSKILNLMKRKPLLTSPYDDSVQLIKIPIGNIPVVENGHIIGLVTISDTVRACFTSFAMLLEEIKTIINSNPNGIITFDVNGRIRIINSYAEKMLDLSSADVLGNKISNNFIDLKVKEIIRTGNTVIGSKLFFKDKILIISISQVKHYDTVIGAVVVLQDISSFDNISEELKYTKELKSYLDSVIESSFDGIYLTDKDGKILLINNAFTRITGIRREDVLFKTMEELVETGIFREPIPLNDIAKGEPVTFSQDVGTGKSVLVTSNPIYEDNIISGIVHNVRDITELNKIKSRLEMVEGLSRHFKDQLKSLKSTGRYIGSSHTTKQLIKYIIRMSKNDATVLLLGESGVGKDLIAEIIHENSPRNDHSMITVNCSAIPDNLIESELFGYEPGAFTGADKKGKIGLFELASGSTLFLDEIGDLPLNLQAKLLRALHNKEITRIGGKHPKKIDVRIIAATNQPLKKMVAEKRFREDLYYRLNVVPIKIPPLRERKEDIPDLLGHFTHMFNKKYGLNKRFDEKIIREFINSDWPGNVRELENAVERSMVTCTDEIIYNIDYLNFSEAEPRFSFPIDIDYRSALEEYEKGLIFDALERFGTTRKVAEKFGVSQPTIVRKAKKYGIKLRNKSLSTLTLNEK